MANFKFKYNILFFPDKERDRAGYKPDGKLRIRVRWAGHKVDFNVGYRVKLSQWDARTQRCIAKTTNLQKQSASLINGYIQQYGDALENIFKTAELDGTIPIPDEVRIKFNEVTGRVDKATDPTAKSLFDHFDEFTREMGSLNNWTYSTKQKFHTVRIHLQSYGSNLRFADLTETKLPNYVSYLRDVRHLRNSSIGKQLDFLKWFLRWALKQGYTSDGSFNSFKPKLKVTQKKIIFLTWTELTRLREYTMPQSHQYLEKIRDVFLFTCFTGLRYSDVANLRRADVFENHIAVTTVKTADSLTIELNDHSRAILDKYRGIQFKEDKALPVISNQRMNDDLKELCRLAEIDEPVRETYFRGNERIDEVYPKYELIGTHAGRRTFICNALALGIPAQVVMKWTGHSDYKAMKPYIDIADDIKANAMSRFNEL